MLQKGPQSPEFPASIFLPRPSPQSALTGTPEARISEGLGKMRGTQHLWGLAYTCQVGAEGSLGLMREAQSLGSNPSPTLAWLCFLRKTTGLSESQFALLRSGSPSSHPLSLPAWRVGPSKQD